MDRQSFKVWKHWMYTVHCIHCLPDIRYQNCVEYLIDVSVDIIANANAHVDSIERKINLSEKLTFAVTTKRKWCDILNILNIEWRNRNNIWISSIYFEYYLSMQSWFVAFVLNILHIGYCTSVSMWFKFINNWDF